MKYLNSEQLAKLIYEERKGNYYRWFSFKEISNPPSIRVSKEIGKVLNCTCKLHSVQDILLKRKCRFILAYENAKESKLI